MIDPLKVGSKIATYRKQLSLTQDDLANRLNVTRQALSKWETGLSLPSIEGIVELSNLFNLPVEELLCLKTFTKLDETDLFKEHSREFVVNQICKGALELSIPDILYQFSPLERLQILKAIKEQKITCNLSELRAKLTQSESKFIFKSKHKGGK